jgi:hypothetical protein
VTHQLKIDSICYTDTNFKIQSSVVKKNLFDNS